MDKVFLKRDDLVLKHKGLSATLKIQKELHLKDNASKTQKQLKKLEKDYSLLQSEIEDYYYSLDDETADSVIKPNTVDIVGMYDYVTSKKTNVKTGSSKENDESLLKEMNDIAKEISKLF